MYNYLTGAASWYMLTMITEVYGVRGEVGNLLVVPKLMAEQFDESGNASIQLEFMKKKFVINYNNANKLTYGEYSIKKAVCDDSIVLESKGTSACLNKEVVEGLDDKLHVIKRIRFDIFIKELKNFSSFL